MVGLALGDARRDRADADLGHQLDRNLGFGIDVLQVVDELLQVFDRIDVVVRRRRDEAHALGGVAHLGDHRVDLVAGQLSALAGLCALRHLDLHHVRVDEIFRRHPEAARGDLLDGAAHRVAVGHTLVAIGFLAALAGIGLAADPVHRDGERGVRLARDRAERHRAGRKAPDDRSGGFDLVERDRRAPVFRRGPDAEETADGQELRALLVEQLGEGVVAVARVAANGVLQQRHRLRRPAMRLSAHPIGVFAADFERRAQHRRIRRRRPCGAAASRARSRRDPRPRSRSRCRRRIRR